MLLLQNIPFLLLKKGMNIEDPSNMLRFDKSLQTGLSGRLELKWKDPMDKFRKLSIRGVSGQIALSFQSMLDSCTEPLKVLIQKQRFRQEWPERKQCFGKPYLHSVK